MRRAPALLLTLVLAGCAAPAPQTAIGLLQSPQWRSGALVEAPPGLPSQAWITGLDFFPDDSTDCGPSALATVLRHAGVDATPQSLKPQVYTPGLHGSLQFDLLGATRRAGRIPYVLPPQLGALFQQIAADQPVLVLQKVGPSARDWHAAVVTGYDLRSDTVSLMSSTASNLQLTIGAFDRSWAAGGRWAFVAMPPDRIPAHAREADYLRAVSDVETVDPKAARIAYGASLSRWPDNLVALFGLGNLAYARGDYAEAARDFRRATQAHPQSADAWNNLAQAQLRAEPGDTPEALRSIDRAIAIGGPDLPIYRKTRRQIEQATAH